MRKKIVIAFSVVVLALIGYFLFQLFQAQSTQSQSTSSNSVELEQKAETITECFEGYRVSYMTSNIEIMGKSVPNGFAHLEGKLFSRHWKEAGREFTLFVARDLDFHDANLQKLEGIYMNTFMVEHDENGTFKAMYFSYETSKEDERLLKGLVLPFQSATKEGIYSENDTNGWYRAEYIQEFSKLHKQKLDYISIDNSSFNIPLTANILKSHSELEASSCWLEYHKGEERVSLLTEATKEPFLRSTLQFSLKRVITEHHNPLKKYEGLSFDAIYEMFQEQVKSTRNIRQEISDEAELKKFKKMNISTEQIVENIVDLKKSIAENALYLKTHPKQLEEVIEKILRGNSSERETMYLVELLAHTGNEVAQKALVDIASSSQQPYESRLRSLVAFSSLRETPTAETLAALYDYQTKLDTSFEFELASSATLALGSLAQNLSHTALHDEVVLHLQEQLDILTNSEGKRAVLLSLANAKPESLDNAQAYLQTDDSALRSAAVVLLSRVGDEKSIDTLLSYESSESIVSVRAELFHRLQTVALSQEQLNYIAKASLSENSVKVRAEMIDVIGKNSHNNEALQNTLKQLKATETNTHNLNKILKYY